MTIAKKRERMRIGFIGAGTVGTALAIRLHEAGYPIVAAASRRLASANALAARAPGCVAMENHQDVLGVANLVFLTVPDDAILDTANGLEWEARHMVVHCSGALGLEALHGPHRLAAQTGALHPLQTFSSVNVALENLPGSTFAVEAGEPLLGILKGFATDLGGNAVELESRDRILYHVSGVIASNYLVALANMAAELWEEFGMDRVEGLRALLPLIKGTVRNLEEIGLPDSLTGPIARGDAGTVEKHIVEIADRRPELLNAYRELALRTIPIAQEKGRIDLEDADKLRRILPNELVREGQV